MEMGTPTKTALNKINSALIRYLPDMVHEESCTAGPSGPVRRIVFTSFEQPVCQAAVGWSPLVWRCLRGCFFRPLGHTFL